MAASDFSYHRPATLAEACELGRSLGGQARYLAGGTELVVDFRSGRDAAPHLISLKNISELRTIIEDRGTLCIGAMATLAEIAESPLVAKRFPVLKEGALTMAGEQIRSLASIGGNFCRAVSCADTPPICIVGEAELSVVGPDGERTLGAEELFTGPRQTQLASGEILTEIRIPEQAKRSGASYQRFALRKGQALAVAAVAARVVLDGHKIVNARVAMGAVAPTPLRAKRCEAILRDKPPSEALFVQAAAEAAQEAKPISDLRGSGEYRREIVEVLTKRALEIAAGRARS